MASEKEVAGHTLEAPGMLSSVIKVGRRMLKPDTKYSVRIWLMAIATTKPISDQALLRLGGRSRPIRSILCASVSSICCLSTVEAGRSGDGTWVAIVILAMGLGSYDTR